jgi:phosphoglycerate dehydrogenase-like enzyme
MHSEFSPNRPLTILLSRLAARDFGNRIDEVLGDLPHRFIHLEDQPESNGHFGTDIAFMTREVTGNSGKTDLADTLVRFYEIMRGSPSLRWMQTHSAGADRPIYPELRSRDVIVTTASGANAAPVAQMAFTGLLALARRFPELMDAQRRKAWEPLLGPRAPRDLKGQTAVVVGLGNVGMEIARLLKALEMHVIGVQLTGAPCPPADETVAFENVREVLPRADWVLLSCPLTELTRGLINASTIELLPPGARVINVARGEVIVEDDLIRALQAGRLGGAYLDVLVKEPLSPASALWELPNVIITPHTAGHTTDHYAAVAEIFLDNLARWRDGQPLRNAIP